MNKPSYTSKYYYDPRDINTIEDCEKIAKDKLQDFFITSCALNKYEVITILLSNTQFSSFIDINKGSDDSTTALMLLAGCSSIKALETILAVDGIKEKINPHLTNRHGWNALMLSVGNDFHRATELLLFEFDIDIDEKTMKWLNGENKINRVYDLALAMIEKRNINRHLHKNLSLSKEVEKKGHKL